MNEVVGIGCVPWSREEMKGRLSEFRSLYDQRPVRDNVGGMRAPHMFLTWFILQRLRPRVVVESGVWLGLGTWLIEKACPEAQIVCLDPVLDRLRYRSSRATYYDRDFTTIDWRDVPKEETLLFFDDHQNAYRRVQAAKWMGFRHLVFEDNYPVPQGDCYSLKKVFAHAGFRPDRPAWPRRARLLSAIGDVFGLAAPDDRGVEPNAVDAAYLRQNLEVYYECPPVFRTERTRWGDPWTDERYPTPPPLLQAVEHEYQRLFLEEAAHYTWLCYVRLG